MEDKSQLDKFLKVSQLIIQMVCQSVSQSVLLLDRALGVL